mgnify:CR=1 FL=1|jgi:hypothetical protein
MATNFPGSLDTSTQQPTIASTDEMDDSGKEHDVVHTNHSGAIIALETKLGTGDSNATANAVLMGTGSGTSEWDTSPTFKGAVTVGVDDTGHDVKFFGATSGKYFEWDESADRLNISGTMRLALLDDSTNYDAATLICGNNTDTTPDAHWNGHFVVDGNGYAGGISLDGSAMWVGHNSSARALYFATNETMRVNITGASGYLYHGTTGADDFPGTDGYFSVKAGDRVAAAFYRQTDVSTRDLIYGLSDHSATGTKHFQVECDGDVDNKNNSYGAISDERLKENIVDARDYYEDLRKLEVKNFNFCKAVKVDYDTDENGEIDYNTKTVSLVDTSAESRKKLLGLIAQPTEQVMAGLVKTDEEGYKHIRYSVLVPMLLQMCQKMADKIEALEG